jgi:hypothetical protein
MSQSNHSVGSVSAPVFRSGMNASLQALASLNSGATAPSTTYANMLWYDTANNTIFMRSEADDAWINIGELDQSTLKFKVAAESLALTGTPTAPTALASVVNTQIATTAYVSNRRNIFVASGGNTADLTLSFENRLSVSFIATTNYVILTTQGAAANTATVNDLVAQLRLYDTVTATDASLIEYGSTVTANGGYSYVSPFGFSLFYGSLTVGRTYQAQLWLKKTQNAGPFTPKQLQVGGIQF